MSVKEMALCFKEKRDCIQKGKEIRLKGKKKIQA